MNAVEPGLPSRVPSLTGLRWWAVSMVFGYHLVIGPFIFPEGTFPDLALVLANPAGSIGVSFFFVLSGFVLTWSVRDRDTAGLFYRRRLARVYPNHLVTTVLAIVLAAITGITDTMHHFVEAFLLVQVWAGDFVTGLAVNGVSWSLACEAFFYLCFPLLFLGIRRLRVRGLWVLAAVCVAAVMAVPTVAALLLPAEPVVITAPVASNVQYWFVYMFPVARLPEFVLGIVAARLVRSGQWLPVGVAPAWLLLGATYLLSALVPVLHAVVAFTVVPIVLLVAAHARADIAGRVTLWATPALVWLGGVSFAFYLVHRMVLETIVLSVLGGSVGTAPAALLTGAVALVLAVLVAWGLRSLVEEPTYRWMTRPRTRRGGPPTDATPDDVRLAPTP